MQCLLHYFTTRHVRPNGVLFLCSSFNSARALLLSASCILRCKSNLTCWSLLVGYIISFNEMHGFDLQHKRALKCHPLFTKTLSTYPQSNSCNQSCLFPPRKFNRVFFNSAVTGALLVGTETLCPQTAAASRPQRHALHHVRTWTWIPFHSSEATPATHTGAGSSLRAAWTRDVIARVLIDLERRCCLQRLSHSALWCQAHMEDSAKDFSHLASPPSTELGFPL